MIRLALVAAFVAGCGTSPQTPFNSFDFAGAAPGDDLATAGSSDGGAQSGDLAMGSGCSVYTKSTIAAMRQAATSGCFEVDNVVSVAVTPITANSTSIRIVAQDAAGGDYSGVLVSCYDSATTKHPCTAFPTAKNILAGRSITVQGYYAKGAAAAGGYEYLSLDSVTDNASGTAPAAKAVLLADIERGAMKPAYWFQKVTLTIAAADMLGMFDFSPSEFKSTTAGATCGSYYGFGMKPKSASGTAGAGCSGTTQPAGQATVNANEVLFGTDFHGGFTANSQCACISTKTNMPYPGLLSTTSTLSGTVSGILFYDAYSAAGYQYLSPLLDADAPITNLSK
jgi:hypothetical protein